MIKGRLHRFEGDFALVIVRYEDQDIKVTFRRGDAEEVDYDTIKIKEEAEIVDVAWLKNRDVQTAVEISDDLMGQIVEKAKQTTLLLNRP